MFMYLMAFDPFMSRFKDNPSRYEQVVDTPPYRYTRIGYSLLTKLFAWNQPERFPMTMIWLILASHFVAALALGAIIRHHGGHPAWALLYMLRAGLSAVADHGAAGIDRRGGAADRHLADSDDQRFALASVVFACDAAGARDQRDRRGDDDAVAVAVAARVARRVRRGARRSCRSWSRGAAFITWRLFPAYGWSSFFFSPAISASHSRASSSLWDVIGRGEYFSGYPPLAVAGRMFPIAADRGADRVGDPVRGSGAMG